MADESATTSTMTTTTLSATVSTVTDTVATTVAELTSSLMDTVTSTPSTVADLASTVRDTVTEVVTSTVMSLPLPAVAKGEKDDFTLFPEADDDPTKGPFTILGVFMLNGKYMNDFGELFTAILVWMAFTYITVHIVATTVALFKLRNHPYGVFVAMPLLFMCLIGPATVGALTSASLAFALKAGEKLVSPWHCAILGVIQTAILAFVSFSRVLATL